MSKCSILMCRDGMEENMLWDSHQPESLFLRDPAKLVSSFGEIHRYTDQWLSFDSSVMTDIFHFNILNINVSIQA